MKRTLLFIFATWMGQSISVVALAAPPAMAPAKIEPKVQMMNPNDIYKPSALSGTSASPSPTPPPYLIELPINANSYLGSIEFSDEKLEEGLKPKVVILLDSSGSMGQVLDKQKSKMFYAKKLFGTYLADQWREKAEVGMVVYGGRRKQDCSDAYFAIPVGERNLSKIDSAVKKLSPVGMTPIARSLQMAVDQLKGYPGPKRIMLFTDGEETCGGDSCKILEAAIQEKIFDLEMFVTGIGLKDNSKDLDKLRCLGQTLGAPDSKSLEKALDKINDAISPKGADGKRISGNNLFVECAEPRARVNIYKLENGTRTFVKMFTAADGIKLPPGEYSAEVNIDPVYTFQKFKIPPNKTVKLKVTGVGYVEVKFFNNLLDVEILNRDKKVVQSFESDQLIPVKSGEYDIRIFGDPFFEHYEKKYRVIPGKKHLIELDDLGVVQVDFPRPVGIHVFDGNNKELGSYLSNFPFVLKAGDYRFFVNDQCNIDGITVRKEKTVQRLQCLKPKN